MGINSYHATGHLTAKPELRHFPSHDLPYTRFTVAVNRGYTKKFLQEHPDAPTADFIPCITKGPQAVYIVNHCNKGSLVTIEGRLRSRRYETEAGEHRSVMEVSVHDIVLGDYRKKSKETTEPQKTEEDAASKAPIPSDDVEDEEIPF